MAPWDEKQMTDVLAKLAPLLQGGGMGAGRMPSIQSMGQGLQSTQGRIGGPPPSMLPGMGGGGGMPGGGMPAMPGMPSQNQPGPSQAIQPGMMSTGFEFDSKAGRDAAVVSAGIQNISQAVAKFKNEDQAKKKATAEGYMSQIMAAVESGDQTLYNHLTQDPKIMKTLEKGLNYIVPSEPAEPAPPEAQGMHAALTKRQQKQQQQQQAKQPQHYMWPQMGGSQAQNQQLADLLAKVRNQSAQQDPALAKHMALGTGMSGQDLTKKERIQSGFELSPVEQAQMSAQQQFQWAKLGQTWQVFQQKQKDAMTQELIKANSGERRASIMAGPAYYRANILRDLGNAKLKIEDLKAKGKMADATKVQMQTLTTQIDTMRKAESDLRKAGNNSAADQFKTDAEALQKEYEDSKAMSNVDADTTIEDLFKD